ncbi:hypothetical protein [Leifsonia sp. NPDC080035]|uniref:Uncharacterized protein n=1 Tax=Leifsonia sp. NPDC080035 TaxID=3143936 RepID=A0AAU7GFJ1_9MICO
MTHRSRALTAAASACGIVAALVLSALLGLGFVNDRLPRGSFIWLGPVTDVVWLVGVWGVVVTGGAAIALALLARASRSRPAPWVRARVLVSLSAIGAFGLLVTLAGLSAAAVLPGGEKVAVATPEGTPAVVIVTTDALVLNTSTTASQVDGIVATPIPGVDGRHAGAINAHYRWPERPETRWNDPFLSIVDGTAKELTLELVDGSWRWPAGERP